MAWWDDALIWPKIVDVYRLNTVAIAAAASPGVDPLFRESRVVNKNDGSKRDEGRQEILVQFQAQIETDIFGLAQVVTTGRSDKAAMVIVARMRDLDALGLLDPSTRAPLIKNSDRLGAIRKLDGTIAQTIPGKPGLYAQEVKPIGYDFGEWGLANYVQISFNDKPLGKPAGG